MLDGGKVNSPLRDMHLPKFTATGVVTDGAVCGNCKMVEKV